MMRYLLLATWALAACGALEDDTDPLAAVEQAECSDPECGGPPPTEGACPSVTAAPPTTAATYSCDLTLLDLYSRPKAGATVTFKPQWCNSSGKTVIGTFTGTTDASGRAIVSAATTRANNFTCSVATTAGIITTKSSVNLAGYASGSTIDVDASRYPDPTTTYYPAGFDGLTGRADLYQSGAYDKVLVIPEWFDPHENGLERSRTKFWKAIEPLLQDRFAGGWDVWLVQPHSTGDNLHEQAAELAQAINRAAITYATPTCGGGRVALLGINTAIVQSRIATARWETDAKYRFNLGINGSALPVNLIFSADGPNYGMQLNLDMQEALWENADPSDIHAETNLDSCAASQLLRKRYNAANGTRTNVDFLNFWVNGTATSFYSPLDGTVHTCAAGPAVASLWPTTPERGGFANGDPTKTNGCVGDPDGMGGSPVNFDLNGAGFDVCNRVEELSSKPFTPTTQAWMHLEVSNAPDQYWGIERNVIHDDLAPGSRSPMILEGLGEAWQTNIFGFIPYGGNLWYRQRYSPTMIPIKSAEGTEGPVAGDPYGAVASPFGLNFFVLDENGVADASYDVLWLNARGMIDSVGSCAPIKQPIGFP